MEKQELNHQAYIILNVKEGDGFSHLKTDLEVCCTFNGKQLIETYTYSREQPLHVIFSWPIHGEFLKRLRNCHSSIQIEIWKKNQLMLGYTTVRVQQAQFTNEINQLFRHRVPLQSSIAIKFKTLPLNIVVTLNINHVELDKSENHISDEEDSCETISEDFIKRLTTANVFKLGKKLCEFEKLEQPDFLCHTSNSSADITESSGISEVCEEHLPALSLSGSDKNDNTDSHITEDLEISYGEDSFNSYYSSGTIETQLSPCLDEPSLQLNTGMNTMSRKEIMWPKRPKKLKAENIIAANAKVNIPTCGEKYDSVVPQETTTKSHKELFSKRLRNECSTHNKPLLEKKSGNKRSADTKEFISNIIKRQELPAWKETSSKPNKTQVIHKPKLKNGTLTSSSVMDTTASNTKLKLDTIHAKTNKTLVVSDKPSGNEIHSGGTSPQRLSGSGKKQENHSSIINSTSNSYTSDFTSVSSTQMLSTQISSTYISSSDKKSVIPTITDMKTENGGTDIWVIDSNQINGENHKPPLGSVEGSTDNKSDILTDWSQRTSSAMTMTSLDLDHDLSVNFHQYMIDFRIESLKWYKHIEDVKVSVRFHNSMYGSIICLVENESLNLLDVFLPEVNSRIFSVCLRETLLKTINNFAPRFLISTYKNSKVIAGATIKLKTLKLQPQTEQPFTIPIIGKHKKKLGKFNVLVSFYDVEHLSDFYLQSKDEKEFKINELMNNIADDVMKLFEINNKLSDLQSSMNAKSQNAIREKIMKNVTNEEDNQDSESEDYWRTFLSMCNIKSASQKSVEKTILTTSEKGYKPEIKTNEKGCGPDGWPYDADLYRNKYTQVETTKEKYVEIIKNLESRSLHLRETNNFYDEQAHTKIKYRESACQNIGEYKSKHHYHEQCRMRPSSPIQISHVKEQIQSLQGISKDVATCTNMDKYDHLLAAQYNLTLLLLHSEFEKDNLQLKYSQTAEDLEKLKHNTIGMSETYAKIHYENTHEKYCKGKQNHCFSELPKNTTKCLTPRRVGQEPCDCHCCRYHIQRFKDDKKNLSEAKKSRIRTIRSEIDCINAKIKMCYEDQQIAFNESQHNPVAVEMVHIINQLLSQWNNLRNELENLSF